METMRSKLEDIIIKFIIKYIIIKYIIIKIYR